MKKILCAILSIVMMLSVITTAAIGVSAEETNFIGKSSLKISYGKGVENGQNELNAIGMCGDFVDAKKDATVSFYVMADGAQVGSGSWWYGMTIGFAVNAWNQPSKDWITLSSPANGNFIGTEKRMMSKQWYRIDVLADRDGGTGNGSYDVYVDGVKATTIERNDAGAHINVIYFRPASCGSSRAATDFYFDNFLVREGLYVPEANDVYSTNDATKITALAGVKGYNELTALPTFWKEAAVKTASIAYGTGVDARNMRMIGHQQSLKVGETMDLRFVGVVDDVSKYTKIGINVAATGKQAQDFRIDTVWTGVCGTVDGASVTYSASSYGYSYVFVADLNGVPTTKGVQSFTITPYAYEGDVRIEFEPITVTYDGANVK